MTSETSSSSVLAVSPAHRWARIVALTLFVALSGALLAHFSMAVHPRFITRPDAVDSQKAILEQRVFVFDGDQYVYPSWRNRVMVPLAIESISALTGITFSQSYILVRWLTACAAIAAFGALLFRVLETSMWLAAAGAAVFTVCLFPTFLHIYEIPSDFIDAASFSLLVLSACEKRRTSFALILLLALTNRESAIFATFVWFALHAWPFQRRTFLRESAYCCILGVVGSALVIWLRVIKAVPGVTDVLQPYSPWDLVSVHWRMIKDFLSYPMYGSPLFFLFGYFIFLALIAGSYWKTLRPPMQRLGIVAAGIYLVSLAYGNIDELRIFIPSLVISTLLLGEIALNEFRRSRPATA
jgi:hypothetical protein